MTFNDTRNFYYYMLMIQLTYKRGLMSLLVHVRKDKTDKWYIHDLKEHLEGVAL